MSGATGFCPESIRSQSILNGLSRVNTCSLPAVSSASTPLCCADSDEVVAALDDCVTSTGVSVLTGDSLLQPDSINTELAATAIAKVDSILGRAVFCKTGL